MVTILDSIECDNCGYENAERIVSNNCAYGYCPRCGMSYKCCASGCEYERGGTGTQSIEVSHPAAYDECNISTKLTNKEFEDRVNECKEKAGITAAEYTFKSGDVWYVYDILTKKTFPFDSREFARDV